MKVLQISACTEVRDFAQRPVGLFPMTAVVKERRSVVKYKVEVVEQSVPLRETTSRFVVTEGRLIPVERPDTPRKARNTD